MNSSDGVILTPDDLLSLGYQKTENDEDMTWNDYWRLIVEAVDTRSSDYLALVRIIRLFLYAHNTES